jgi:hypothetical protein
MNKIRKDLIVFSLIAGGVGVFAKTLVTDIPFNHWFNWPFWFRGDDRHWFKSGLSGGRNGIWFN